MAEKDKKYYWLKLKRDFFKRHDIQIIEDMPNGKDYILFYLKLLCESVDHEGNLRFSEEIPYNEAMLASLTHTNVDIVRSAVKLFAELRMIDILDDGTYYMTQVQKMIGSETYWAQKKREQKERKLLSEEYKYIRVLSHEQFALPNGETRFVDEKRYGGNGKAVWERAQCKCEICGAEESLCIHHNNGYSNELEDLGLVCRSCHRKIETGEISVGKFPIESNLLPTCPSKSIEKEKELDIELDKEKETISDSPNPLTPPPPPEKTKKKQPEKHKRGEYQHVLLTDEQEDKLIEEYGMDFAIKAITFLDEYIEMKGYKAKNHYLAIRKWVIDAVKEKEEKDIRSGKAPKQRYGEFDVNDAFQKALDRSYKTTGNDDGLKERAELLKARLSQ